MSATGAGFPQYRGGVTVRPSLIRCEQHHLGHPGESGFPDKIQERPNFALVSFDISLLMRENTYIMLGQPDA